MFTINNVDRPTYVLTSAEGGLLAAPQAPVDGALAILIDQSQLWVARGGTWAYQLPLTFSMVMPDTPLPDGVTITAPIAGGGTTTVTRPVVAIGSNVNGQVFSGIEMALERLIDLTLAQLTEMRAQTLIQANGLGGFPLIDDLDQIRAAALVSEETITR